MRVTKICWDAPGFIHFFYQPSQDNISFGFRSKLSYIWTFTIHIWISCHMSSSSNPNNVFWRKPHAKIIWRNETSNFTTMSLKLELFIVVVNTFTFLTDFFTLHIYCLLHIKKLTVSLFLRNSFMTTQN